MVMSHSGKTNMKPKTQLPNKKQISAVILVLLVGASITWFVMHNAGPAAEVSGEGGEAATEAAKGPHGGRQLSEGDFATEVTIFERGVPPEFRVFFYEKDKPIDPAEVRLTIELHRFGGRVVWRGASFRRVRGNFDDEASELLANIMSEFPPAN